MSVTKPAWGEKAQGVSLGPRARACSLCAVLTLPCMGAALGQGACRKGQQEPCGLAQSSAFSFTSHSQ